MYLANQIDGKIFDDRAVLPPRAQYSDYVQTKVSCCTLLHGLSEPLFRGVVPLQRSRLRSTGAVLVHKCANKDHRNRHAAEAGIEGLALRLQVSYNGAATWAELTPPERPTFPECSTCRPSNTCKLHLHGPSSWHYGAGVLLPAPPSFCARVDF